MSESKLRVELLSMTEEPVGVIYSACRQCYAAKFSYDIHKDCFDEADKSKQEEFIKGIVKSGHETPLEHVSMSFAIEGVSRTCTHQLVRHRLASYSQQSQRYVKEFDFDYIVPPSIKQDKKLLGIFENTMRAIQDNYISVVNILKEKGKKSESCYEDARFLLPGAAETKIVVTMNCRELIHFFKVRCCTRTQWELKGLADAMRGICKKVLPAVFEKSDAKCVSLGYCPEGPKFTCGRYPLKEVVLQK